MSAENEGKIYQQVSQKAGISRRTFLKLTASAVAAALADSSLRTAGALPELLQTADELIPLQEFAFPEGPLGEAIHAAIKNKVSDTPAQFPLFLKKDGSLGGFDFPLTESDLGRKLQEYLAISKDVLTKQGQIQLEFTVDTTKNHVTPFLRFLSVYNPDPTNPKSVRFIPDALHARNTVNGQPVEQWYIPIPGWKGSVTRPIRMPSDYFPQFSKNVKALNPNIALKNEGGLIFGQAAFSSKGNEMRLVGFAAKSTAVLLARDFGETKGPEMKQTPTPDSKPIGVINNKARVVSRVDTDPKDLDTLKKKFNHPNIFWDGPIPYADMSDGIYYLVQNGKTYGWVRSDFVPLSADKGPLVPPQSEAGEGPTITDNHIENVTEGNFHGFETMFHSRNLKFMTDIPGLNFTQYDAEKLKQNFQVLGLHPLRKNTRVEFVNWVNPDDIKNKNVISIINGMAICHPQEDTTHNTEVYQVFVNPKEFGDMRRGYDVALIGLALAFLYQEYIGEHPDQIKNINSFLTVGNTIFTTPEDNFHPFLGMTYKKPV